MIWNGPQAVDVEAWKGKVGSTALGVQSDIPPGGEVTFTGFADSQNDVFWEILDAETGDKIGESVFHLSCSDQDMNGPEDCGKAQGNGKGDHDADDDDDDSSGGYITQWQLEGMVGASGTLDCNP